MNQTLIQFSNREDRMWLQVKQPVVKVKIVEEKKEDGDGEKETESV